MNIVLRIMLNIIYQKKQRSLCAQLRCGVLPLAVETRQYIGLEEEKLVCSLCCLNEIESEIQLAFYLLFYGELRETLFSKMKANIDFLSMDDADRLSWFFIY